MYLSCSVYLYPIQYDDTRHDRHADVIISVCDRRPLWCERHREWTTISGCYFRRQQVKQPLQLYYLTCAFGVFGNIVVMIVLLSAAQLRRKPINLFFTHQSFIDCIVCCITIVEEVTLVHYNGPGVCHFIYSKMLSNVTQYASSYNLTILTVEQHFAIVSPLQYNREKVVKGLPIVFIAEWVLCFCSLLFLPFTYHVSR